MNVIFGYVKSKRVREKWHKTQSFQISKTLEFKLMNRNLDETKRKTPNLRRKGQQFHESYVLN